LDEAKRNPMNRRRILVSADWFPPAYRAGGPIRSAYNLCALLSEKSDVWVVTGAHDLGEAEALEVQKDAWNTVQMGQETIQVRYCTKGSLDQNSWSEIVDEIKPDFIHLNSMFSKEHALMPLRVARKRSATQVVLAPRGMLGSAALAIKPLKKRVFLSFARMLDLFKGVIWHASTSSEASEIRMHFRTANVCVAQNLPASLPAHNPKRPEDRWKIVGDWTHSSG
jgi:hypothetical protein